MNRADGFQGLLPFRWIAEREREHRASGVMQAREGRDRAAAKRAVLRDAGGNQRMGKLQQDCPHPAEHDETLGVDAPRTIGRSRARDRAQRVVVSQVPSESDGSERTEVWRTQML